MILVKGYITEVDSVNNFVSDITFTLVDEHGRPVAGVASGGYAIVEQSHVGTTEGGYFEIELYPNSDITIPNSTLTTRYRISTTNVHGLDFDIYISGLSTPVWLHECVNTSTVPTAIPPDTRHGLYVLEVGNDGALSWSSFATTGLGDMHSTVYDTESNGTVDDAEKVNGKIVELNVLNVPISTLQASDDFDNA